MLVYRRTFLSLPESQREAMEGVLQATVSELFDLTQFVVNHLRDQEDPSWVGDRDGKFSTWGNTVFYEDHSADWWAVLTWEHPHKDHPDEMYRSWVSLTAFVSSGKPPSKINQEFKSGRVDLNALCIQFLEGNSTFYVQALRTNEGKWSGSPHNINLQHPLLFILRIFKEECEKNLATPKSDS